MTSPEASTPDAPAAPPFPRCETCKWWDDVWKDWNDYNEEPFQPVIVSDDQTLPWDQRETKAPGRWGNCTLVSEFRPDGVDDRFYVIDGSEYKAALHTRSDFGCVEYEPKEPE